jgi:hypothetical protein
MFRYQVRPPRPKQNGHVFGSARRKQVTPPVNTYQYIYSAPFSVADTMNAHTSDKSAMVVAVIADILFSISGSFLETTELWKKIHDYIPNLWKIRKFDISQVPYWIKCLIHKYVDVYIGQRSDIYKKTYYEIKEECAKLCV